MVTHKSAYIPESIGAQLGRLSLLRLETTAVGDVTFGSLDDSLLLGELDGIIFRAERCERFHQDENAWGSVIRSTLDLMIRLYEERRKRHRDFEIVDL